MDRRPITRRVVLSGVSALAGTAMFPALGTQRRPNILLVLADDWSWQGAEAVDRLELNMPNFARIQRLGVNFTNAFVASPSCTASRGALLTGQWPWRLEEGANLASILRKKFPLYTDLLEESGYHVGYARKGWGPGKLEPVGRSRNPAGTSYADFDAFLAKRPEKAPFCFWFGTHDPHRPYAKGEGIRNGVDPSRIVVPPYLPDTPEVRSDIADYRFELERLDRETGVLLDRLARDGELDNTLVVITGDNGWPFPRGKATLYDAGWHVPLAIMWTAQAQGNRTTGAMVSVMDLAATFLDVAGVAQPQQMNARSLTKLLRNGGDSHRSHVLGGLERHLDGRTVPGHGYPMRALRTPTHLYIRNFRPERWPAGDPPRGPVDQFEVEKSVFAAFADIDAGPTKAQMVTRREGPAGDNLLALATGKRPPYELYDVRADPYELHNLAADPAHQALAAELDRRLMQELRETGDPRILDGGDVFDNYPSYSDPRFARPAHF